MRTTILTLALALSLSGCAFDQEDRKPDVIEVPVIVKCTPSVKVTPIDNYPTDGLRKDMPLYDKFQLVLSELSLVKGNNKELKAALAECTK